MPWLKLGKAVVFLPGQEPNLDGELSTNKEQTNSIADARFDDVLKAYKETQAYKERERLIEEDKKRQRVQREKQGRYPAAAAVEQASAWLENKDRLWGLEVPDDKSFYETQVEEREGIEKGGYGEEGKIK
jgi:hypothetical protein